MNELASNAFELRTGVLGKEDNLPWESLAAAVREPHMDRVKIGAARLSNLFRIHRRIREKGELPKKDGQHMHFGHFLLAELRERDDKFIQEHFDLLETSHSGWRLSQTDPDKVKPPATCIASVLDMLKHVKQIDGGPANARR
jgi:hypothetical protein